MTGRMEIPSGITAALTGVGVEVRSSGVDVGDTQLAAVVRLPGHRGSVTLSTRLDPEPAHGREAAIRRHAAPSLGDALWLSSPRVSVLGTLGHSDELLAEVLRYRADALLAEVLRYRADALLWHALAEGQIDGDFVTDLAVSVPAVIDGVEFEVPVLLYPSAENVRPGWSAEALFGQRKFIDLAGSGLLSMPVLRAALADRLLDESFDAAPNAERCASTLSDHARVGVDWADTLRPDRATALLMGLCRECAQNLRATRVPPLPIQPPKWGEKYR